MAFEIPLDADQVDDLNLFSTLVRAPVIGTLLWILGSSKRQSQHDDDDVREHFVDDDGNDDESNHLSSAIKGDGKSSGSRQQPLKNAVPSLIGSEISENDLVESLDAASLYGYNGSCSSTYASSAPKKELSWSDEVGKNLVVYEGESSIHEPKPSYEQPSRPALIRSRSIRSDADNLTKSHMENKYLPSNPYRPNKPILKHHSMPYPTQSVEPYSSGTNGYESPQWGWYINTTPPSPEMFYSSRSNKVRKGTDSTSDTSEISRDSVLSNVSGNSAYPNPVFQCLQDKHKTTPAGWPSVPL